MHPQSCTCMCTQKLRCMCTLARRHRGSHTEQLHVSTHLHSSPPPLLLLSLPLATAKIFDSSSATSSRKPCSARGGPTEARTGPTLATPCRSLWRPRLPREAVGTCSQHSWLPRRTGRTSASDQVLEFLEVTHWAPRFLVVDTELKELVSQTGRREASLRKALREPIPRQAPVSYQAPGSAVTVLRSTPSTHQGHPPSPPGRAPRPALRGGRGVKTTSLRAAWRR